MDINNLTKDELWDLREEIGLNSVFINDYENSYGIPARNCCNFFDGYLSYLSELMDEDNIDDEDFWDYIDHYDNADNLYDWYYCCEYPFGEWEGKVI